MKDHTYAYVSVWLGMIPNDTGNYFFKKSAKAQVEVTIMESDYKMKRDRKPFWTT